MIKLRARAWCRISYASSIIDHRSQTRYYLHTTHALCLAICVSAAGPITCTWLFSPFASKLHPLIFCKCDLDSSRLSLPSAPFETRISCSMTG
ncbi:hypothetical protein BOTBODRAFT_473231 [Botryobasidium botryosum FD-172 SS1]|uniref:Uncharacterized protein n=1 Tax=Botryobasidium botryosum (strain FD-172 SS1) TaxID=930990 RepID=A0A067M7T3_BOTB1|nr:hypothetical protein BOTBODRAFT_473231 [Botryobasidium botryosum FD-172 SS1]